MKNLTQNQVIENLIHFYYYHLNLNNKLDSECSREKELMQFHIEFLKYCGKSLPPLNKQTTFKNSEYVSSSVSMFMNIQKMETLVKKILSNIICSTSFKDCISSIHRNYTSSLVNMVNVNINERLDRTA